MTINKVFYRSPHNYDLDKASDDATVKDFGPSLTVQSMAEDVDINVIMKRFGVTGKMPDAHPGLFYGDFDGVFDYRSALDKVRAADELFMAMPAEVRSRFNNDPQLFMDFCDKRTADGSALENLEEMRKLGLAVPKAPPSGPPPADRPAAAAAPAAVQQGPPGAPVFT